MPMFGAKRVLLWFMAFAMLTTISSANSSLFQPTYSLLDNVPSSKSKHRFESHSGHEAQSNDSTHIIRLIEWMEVHTDYKILYRESQIHDIQTQLTEKDLASYAQILSRQISNEGIEQTLLPIRQAIELAATKYEIEVQWDSNSRQVILYTRYSANPLSNHFFRDENKVSNDHISLRIEVLDNLTGELLSLSQLGYRYNRTEAWSNNIGINKKLVPIPIKQENKNYLALVDSLHLLVYHVGYAIEEIDLPVDSLLYSEGGLLENISPITVRLTPKTLYSNEIVILGETQRIELGREMHDHVQTDIFGTSGEAHTTRALQQLASVGLSGAVSDGMYIRGSDPTGFKVLLDRQQVYHDHHMFGVIDAMVPDALQPSAFYYNSIPARYSAPIGGLLDLKTRYGNRQNFRLSSNLSNAAFSLTTEGPLFKAKSSWLLAARHSIYNHVPQLSPTNLIHFGLDINRRYSLKMDAEANKRFSPIDTDKIDIPFTDASINSLDHSFYDLHGSWNYEIDPSSIWSMSFYQSSDDASTRYQYPVNSTPDSSYNANHAWNATHVVAEHHKELSSQWLLYLKVGLSRYKTDFSKDDYEYQTSELNNIGYYPGTVSALFLENDIRDFNVLHSWIYSTPSRSFEAGLSYTDYLVNFSERSLVIPSLNSTTSSQLLETFLQWEQKWSTPWQTTLGTRAQYYSSGKQFYLNPTLLIRYQSSDYGTFILSANQTQQYIHKLELYNQKSLDFWILTQEKQRPSQMNQLSFGWEQTKNNLQYRSELYLKSYANLRLYQLNAGLMSSLYNSTESTWLNETNGLAKGWEHYVHYNGANHSVWLRYTWSQIQLKNTLINNDTEFDAPWDRPHQATLNQSFSLNNIWSIHIQGITGTGTPAIYGQSSELLNQRLPMYLRWDVHLKLNKALKSSTFTAHLSLFNVFNRDNVWYSDRIQANYTLEDERIRIYPQRQVYDLGFYPSFRVRFTR